MRRFDMDDSFEDFLKRQADGLQMRPSDLVWEGVADQLNRRRWGVRVVGLLMIAATATGLTIWMLQVEAAHENKAQFTYTQQTQQLPADWQAAPVVPLFANERNPGISGLPTTVNRHRVKKLEQQTMRFRAVPVTEPANEEFDPALYAQMPETDGNTGKTTTSDRFSLFRSGTGNSDLKAMSSGTRINQKDEEQGVSLQFFLAPSVSYRSFSDARKNADDPAHTPGSESGENSSANLGLELGLTAKYPLARNLRLQGGLQFNMSRSTQFTGDRPVASDATMQLPNQGMFDNRALSSSGLATGMYVQLSAPIGLEFQVSGNHKTQFGVASTIQPSFILNDQAGSMPGMKGPDEAPATLRRWNVNTAFVTYVAYSTGKINWQVGPQVRYQLMSSFMQKYPIRENLLDFGLRVGVSLKGKK